MNKFSLLLLLPLLLAFTACGSDGENDNADDQQEYITPQPPPEIPRPGGCSFLTDEFILETMGVPDATISTQPGPYDSSCRYRIEARQWSADMEFQVGDGSRAAGIIMTVKQAPEDQKTTVNGKDALIKNDNRWMEVSAAPPYVIKFSALARPGEPEVITSAERRRILETLGKALEEAI